MKFTPMKPYCIAGALFVIITLSSGCKKEAIENFDPMVQVVLNDYAYGDNGSQKMDISLPAGRSPVSTNTLVFIHGGAWSSGDKAELNPSIVAARNLLPNWATLNLNYRLLSGTKNQYPTQELDVGRAIERYLQNSAAFGVSNRLVLVGASAGAHLAMLYAYKNNIGKQVKAVIDFYGPTDLARLYNEQPLAAFSLTAYLGKPLAEAEGIYRQASPIFFIDQNTPPTFILHGALDEVVPVTQSQWLAEYLNNQGSTYEGYVYAAEGHGFSAENMEDAIARSVAFIKKYVE